MDRSDVINLIAVTRTQDEYGVWRKTETSRAVYCAVNSVSRTEYFEAGRNGLNPSYQLVMFAPDYQDEPIVEYKGKRYSVYRTYYAKNDQLELYVQREGGTNGTEEGNG